MNNEIYIKALKKLVKNRAPIVLNNNLLKLLNCDDWRDFFEEIHSWGYSRDFTYQTTQNDFNRFVKLFIKENYLN